MRKNVSCFSVTAKHHNRHLKIPPCWAAHGRNKALNYCLEK